MESLKARDGRTTCSNFDQSSKKVIGLFIKFTCDVFFKNGKKSDGEKVPHRTSNH